MERLQPSGSGKRGREEGEVRSGLCKLIFPLFSFQLQIASDSSLKYTHEFFDSFFPKGRMDLMGRLK